MHAVPVLSPPTAAPLEPAWLLDDQPRQIALRSRTGLNFADLMMLNPVTPEAMAAFQQLLCQVNQLRAIAPNPITDSNLLPYVMDELLDVVQAVAEPEMVQPTVAASDPAIVLLDSLMPRLLWRIASFSYPMMQLLEGVSACALPPGERWQPGVVRLAAILELRLGDRRIAIDLATARPPMAPLALDWQVQTDGDLIVHPRDRPLGQTLQQWTAQLAQAHPIVAALLQGTAVDGLLPGQSWQSGDLTLRLGLEFLPQTPEERSLSEMTGYTWIEAELLEETSPRRGGAGEFATPWQGLSPIADDENPRLPAIIELLADLPSDAPNNPLAEVALIRLADPASQEQYHIWAAQQSLWPWLQQVGHLVQQAPAVALLPSPTDAHGDGEIDVTTAAPWLRSLLSMAEQAATTPPLPAAEGCLLQPELLMDELVPKLLWRLARCSYAIAQLLDSVAVRWLHPTSGWVDGRLRLRAILECSGSHLSERIDLATERFLSSAALLSNGFTQQLSPLSRPATAPNAATTLLQLLEANPPFNPTDTMTIAALLARVAQQVQQSAPDLEPLLEGVVMEWFTAEQDWQPGHLQIHLQAELIA
jgi:hypothetical protein